MGNLKTKIAYLISRLFGPLPLVCFLWLIVALKSGIGFWRAIWVYPVILLTSVAFPIIISTYLIYFKKVKDIEWSDINDRKKYLFPIMMIALFFLNLTSFLLTNSTLFHLSLLTSSIALILVAIWIIFNFKISGHITVATSVFTAVNLFFHFKLWWIFLFLIPIVWARKTLKLHTYSQLIAGFIMPVIIMLLALLIFGWPNVPR